MAYYSKGIGRLHVTLNENGAWQHDYRHGGEIACLSGSGVYDPNNRSYDDTHSNLSVEEMRDLRYLLDRAIAAAEEEKGRRVARGMAA